VRYRIFWGIFLVSVLGMLISAGAVMILAQGLMRSNVVSALESYTRDLGSAVSRRGGAWLSEIASYSYRVTLINPDGSVAYDSQADSGSMPNHLNRKEVSEALKRGAGSDSRLSDTLSERTHYYALKLDNGQVLRCAVTAKTLFRISSQLFGYFVLAVLCAALFSAYVSGRIARRITDPVNRIDLDHPLESDVYDELTPLVGRIAQQQEHIAEQMKKIKSQSEELVAITGSMTEGLVILNARGEVLSINKSACDLLDTDPSCVGRTFLAVDRSEYVHRLFEQQPSKKSSSAEFEKNGKIYKVFFNRVGSKHDVHGYALIYIDVTQQRIAEQQRQEFTANVSHELKTPLQSIIGAAELLESGLVKSGDEKDFYARIRREGHALLGMINDIIFLSRLDERSAKDAEENIDPAAVCAEVVKGLCDKAAAKNITLSLEGEGTPFRGIYRYFYEMIFNLAENAVKYGREGGFVKIAISEDKKNRFIKVSDNGIGIPKEAQDRIFERFFRVDKSHSKRYEGTGLGLSIVKRVALFFGGTVSVKSESGQGSEFTVTMPKKLKKRDLPQKSDAAKQGD
jgi:two-component system phosphate regulon sensor histidine kinase PhoR